MLVQDAKNLVIERGGVLNCLGPKLGARFAYDADLRPLFPLIKGNLANAHLYDRPERVQFLLDGILCTLYAQEVVAAPFLERDQVLRFIHRLTATLNDLYTRRHSLGRNHRKTTMLPVYDIYRLLPGTNCTACGQPSCLAFAAALSRGRSYPDRCPGFRQPIAHHAVYPVYDQNGNLASTLEVELAADADELNRQALPTREHPVVALLTAREKEVLRLLAKGASNPEIAAVLAISPHTVKTHVGHLFDKLGVNDRTQAAVWAHTHHYL